MKKFYSTSPKEVKKMDTEELRENFLIDDLFENKKLKLNYLHYDRVIVGGATPLEESIELKTQSDFGTNYFLERRELGIINIAGPGIVEHDKEDTILNNKDGLYLPVGNKKIIFKSLDVKNPAKFYLFSTVATEAFEYKKINIHEANKIVLGSEEESNLRTIYQYFLPKTCKTNSLLMGLTVLEPKNIWNTMPPHTHERRFESYLYFDIPEDERIFHFMGQPQETRHLIAKNQSCIISPPWSIHTGVGTKSYSFIWSMSGENMDFTDMQAAKKESLK